VFNGFYYNRCIKQREAILNRHSDTRETEVQEMGIRTRIIKNQKCGIIKHPRPFKEVTTKGAKEKEALRKHLYERDGTKCHYCGIEEKEFFNIWKKKFYGTGTRGRRLEIDRKNNELGYTLENTVLACALCNMAKTDFLTYDEFKRVGNLIREIWQERKREKAS
jgi:5-methylcytosine-specific restriction endonuclease McrA